MTEDRVMIFIDGQNLMRGANRVSVKIDLNKLVTSLTNGRKLEGKYYYGSIPLNPNKDPDIQIKVDKQMGFYNFLDRSGFKTVIIPLKKRTFKFECGHCGHTTTTEKPVEKGVDVALASDMLSLAADGAYDVAVMVSGDYDHHKAIEDIQRRGMIVEIAYFKNCGISTDLIKLANRFIDLEKIIDNVMR